MMQLALQLFGGRGAKSGATSSGKVTGGGGGSFAEKPPTVKRKTAAQINSMSRSEAVSAARAVYLRNNMQRGMSKAEATRRFNALVDSNTTAQLKKYIKKYQ